MSARAEIAISFDTTGSMAACIHTVRDSLDRNIKRVLHEHPAARFAVIAHGDYCDADETYVTKLLDFTSDVTALTSFVQSVEDTYGGDADECYELVLRKVRTELSWTPGSKRAFVLIGDCGPHPPDYPDNVDNIDWREEVEGLAEMGIKGYAVYCTDDDDGEDDDDDEWETTAMYEVDDEDKEMYETLASQTGGVFLKLSDLANISDLLVAICKHQQGPAYLEDYEHEVRQAGQLSADMEAVFASLRQHQQL